MQKRIPHLPWFNSQQCFFVLRDFRTLCDALQMRGPDSDVID